jgi:DNA repair exonuclease SbcCD ATPase subunit
MEAQNKDTITIEKLAQNLASFAIDRADLKELMSAIPKENNLNLTTIEYELSILKILSVGWGISFFMAVTDKNKATLTQLFWEMIKEISKKISELTQTTTGTQMDYFSILKQRLAVYVEQMQDNPEQANNPALIMGPVFADLSGSPGDAIATLTGTKMFALTLGAVKEYINILSVDDIRLN